MVSLEKENNIRKSPRINLDLRAAISTNSTGKRHSEVISASIKTLGSGGLMIDSPIPLKEGELVEMTLFFQSTAISFISSVVWKQQMDKKKQKTFRCGLTFRSISDEDLMTIKNFVHKQLQISQVPPHKLNPGQ
jgi:c-di-GMP-binding flagellar brake protein YcgR